jgi:CRISPR system Cascade subunit CasA
VLFSGDYSAGVAGRLQPSDRDGSLFVASVLVRGQGKTEGLHERLLPIPARVRSLLASSEGTSRIGGLAKQRVEVVTTARRSVLHPALCALLQGAPEKLDFRDDRTDVWTAQLDRAVDAIFFERLWRDLEREPAEADRAWTGEVIAIARAILERAIRGAPVPAARRYRALAAAERIFGGAVRRKFPDLTLKEEPRDGATTV